MCVCVCVCVCVCARARMFVCLYLCFFAYLCVSVCQCVCGVCMSVCMHASVPSFFFYSTDFVIVCYILVNNFFLILLQFYIFLGLNLNKGTSTSNPSKTNLFKLPALLRYLLQKVNRKIVMHDHQNAPHCHCNCIYTALITETPVTATVHATTSKTLT